MFYSQLSRLLDKHDKDFNSQNKGVMKHTKVQGNIYG